MGQCGCIDVDPNFIIKINNNSYLLILLHLPCQYCGVGFDLSIEKMNKQEMNDYYDIEFYKDKIIDIKKVGNIDNRKNLTLNICGGDSMINIVKNYLSDESAEEFIDNQYMILNDDYFNNIKALEEK